MNYKYVFKTLPILSHRVKNSIFYILFHGGENIELTFILMRNHFMIECAMNEYLKVRGRSSNSNKELSN